MRRIITSSRKESISIVKHFLNGVSSFLIFGGTISFGWGIVQSVLAQDILPKSTKQSKKSATQSENKDQEMNKFFQKEGINREPERSPNANDLDSQKIKESMEKRKELGKVSKKAYETISNPINIVKFSAGGLVNFGKNTVNNFSLEKIVEGVKETFFHVSHGEIKQGFESPNGKLTIGIFLFGFGTVLRKFTK